MTVEEGPSGGDVPYLPLSRTRYGYQLDSAVSGIVQRAVANLLPNDHAVTFARAVRVGVARVVLAQTQEPQPPVLATRDLAEALAEFEELCPRPRPRPWFSPRSWRPTTDAVLGPVPDPWVLGPEPDPWRPAAGAAEASAAVLAALGLLRRAGSDQLRAQLEPSLLETLGILAS